MNVVNPIGIYTLANITIEDCIFDRFGGAAIQVMPWVLGRPPSLRYLRRGEGEKKRALQESVIAASANHATIRISGSIFRNGRITLGESSSTIWLRHPNDEARPLDSDLVDTAVSLVLDDCLFDARGNDKYYDSAILARGEGRIRVTNTCFWSGQYVNKPILINEREKSHVIANKSDYQLAGNYYQFDHKNFTGDTEKYCAVLRRKGQGECLGKFSGQIDVCTDRWSRVLSDESTVNSTGLSIELNTTCGADAIAQKNYRGMINTTIRGRTCQAWDSQSPHTHSRTVLRYPNAGLEANYCRNPDNEPAAWCYTTDPFKRFELCDVPNC